MRSACRRTAVPLSVVSGLRSPRIFPVQGSTNTSSGVPSAVSSEKRSGSVAVAGSVIETTVASGYVAATPIRYGSNPASWAPSGGASTRIRLGCSAGSSWKRNR